MISFQSIVPPVPGRDGDFDRLVLLLSFVSDHKACAARLSELHDAAAEAGEVIASADKVKAEIKIARDLLKTEQAAHAKKLTNDREAFEQACHARDQTINDRKKDTEKLHAAATAHHANAARISAELQGRLERVKAAAA